MVQRKMFSPTPRPVTEVCGSLASAKVPEPVTNVQVPIAAPTGALPSNVVLPAGVQSDWSAPAFAAGAVLS